MFKQLLKETAEGRGQLALVQGGLACGKTELLHGLAEYAGASGALVLSAAGSRAESDLQAGLIDQFFRSEGVPADVTERVEGLLSPEAFSNASAYPGAHCVQPQSVRVVHELCGVILELARLRPLVITVDDVQFADGASIQLLLYVLRRMRSARILMVVTEWDPPEPAVPVFRAELTRRPHREIRLGPLSREDVGKLVTDVLGVSVDADLADTIHDLTGGNPMLVHTLIKEHQRADPAHGDDRPGEADALVVGFPFGQATLACLQRWGPELLEVARAVAVLGDQGDSELIGKIIEIRGDDADRLLHILTSAGLLIDGRFRHVVAERAVLGTLLREERSAMHVGAAKLLYQRGAEAIGVARQIIAADQPIEPWMVPVLRAAAEQALGDDDIAFAERCLAAVLPMVADDDRLAITAALARAVWRVNPSATAPYLPSLQAAIQTGALQGRDAVMVVRYMMWNGDREGVAQALSALRGTATLADARVAAELRLAYQWYYGSERGRFSDMAPRAGTSPEPWSRAANRLAAVWNHKEDDIATESAEQILQSSQLGDATIEVIASALLVLVAGHKLDRATSWCDRLIDEAERRGAVTWQAVLSAVRAAITLRRGRVAVAAEQAEQALRLLSPQNWGVLIGYPLSTLVSAFTLMGRYEDAACGLRYIVPEEMFDTLSGLLYLRARGHHHLATDRVLAAISDFQRCGTLMGDRSPDFASTVPWRSDLAEANLRLGRPAVARDLVKQQLEQAKSMDDRTRGISLRVLAAASPLAERPGLLRRAVECMETVGDRMELARTLEELSQMHQELGELDRARLLARRAAQELKACLARADGGPQPEAGREPEAGSPPDAGRGHEGRRPAEARALARPGRQPVTTRIPAAARGDIRPRRTDAELTALSDAQRRVADLAALGHTNQEISRRLYITVSTVEQHLTRVFRKLGVTNREDLPLSLSEVS
ncbi:AAA family ATPase [Sphaerisporangium sp. TRM90804]|uniref:helix-turn-helix transcriptional regulator n=1 Tax=Sphaerisporangium sp. TRM90804 TaxID=3031113 RepID=UPI0024499D1D|nr:AAA family ATPase [Sphaerisporangium sp. TRM90804]MDH2430512.1 AAA family ATPase [Sphaerisporangium sp. TRM90804]